ncbi:phage holin family protein [Cellulomonas composti]|uniref:Membrane protein n=1 Tax=Cellulomonas composti TaxID=266130 RepID=A0A511JDI7_9CELL|nr:phage holin family protein [Cellulomonas composti]GEL96044.1 membrane protein [Cellulomonas composti]
MTFFVRVLVNGFAIWLAAAILSGFDIVGGDTTWERIGIVLVVAVIFGIVNAVVKPIVQFLSIPLYILTLGLFTLIVNALMLLLTEWLTDFVGWGIWIDGFWDAVWAALLISLFSFGLSLLIPDRHLD